MYFLFCWYKTDGTHPNTDVEYYSMLEYIKNTSRVDLIYNYYYPLSDFDNVTMAWYTINGDVCFVWPSLIFTETINTISNNNNDSNTMNGFVYYFPSPSSPYFAEFHLCLLMNLKLNIIMKNKVQIYHIKWYVHGQIRMPKFVKPNITNEYILNRINLVIKKM